MLLEQFSDLIGQNSCLFRRYNVAPELAERLHRCQKLIAETHRAIWRRAVNALVENGRMAQELYPGKTLYLEVRTWNQRAVRCYEHVGFVLDGAPYTQTTGAGTDKFYRMVFAGKA